MKKKIHNVLETHKPQFKKKFTRFGGKAIREKMSVPTTDDRLFFFIPQEEVFSNPQINKRIKELAMAKTKSQLAQELKATKKHLDTAVAASNMLATSNVNLRNNLEKQTREYTDAAIKWENEVGELKTAKLSNELQFNYERNKSERLLNALLKIIDNSNIKQL